MKITRKELELSASLLECAPKIEWGNIKNGTSHKVGLRTACGITWLAFHNLGNLAAFLKGIELQERRFSQYTKGHLQSMDAKP